MSLKSCYDVLPLFELDLHCIRLLLFTLIAENAAPVCFANALPRITVTVAVFATRIGHTLVAKFTFPSPSTPGERQTIQLIKTLSIVFYSKHISMRSNKGNAGLDDFLTSYTVKGASIFRLLREFRNFPVCKRGEGGTEKESMLGILMNSKRHIENKTYTGGPCSHAGQADYRIKK